jgi:hypothetical protein
VKSKWLIIGILIVAGLFLIGLFLPKNPNSGRTANSAQRWQPDPRGVAVAKLLSADDFSSYLQGKRSVGDWSGIQPVEERATAVQLYAAYSANEVAADNGFKGKTLVLTGTLRKISKDILNNIYVVVDGGGYLRDVKAFLADSASREAAQLRPGEDISLICTGAGMILTSPILKQCMTVEAASQAQRSNVEKIVDEAFGHDSSIPAQTKLLIGYGYVVGSALSKGNACETATPENMTECRRALGTVERSKSAALYDEFAKQHGFPPRPNE